MKLIFLGATDFSKQLLLHLLDTGHKCEAVFTIPEKFNISYSSGKVKNYNYRDLSMLCENNNIAMYFVDSEKGKKLSDYFSIIQEIKPDIIFVLGWYYMVPSKIRNLAKYGAWGIHASLLPDYAGGAPLVWAIIKGEKETGVTLFRLGDGVDDGDIIAQAKFSIEYDDTIKEVYDKATIASKKILSDVLSDIDNICFSPQDKTKIKIFPQRTPDDGKIDLTKPAEEIYNFIRAQAPPYPGAFIELSDGKKLILEKVRIEDAI